MKIIFHLLETQNPYGRDRVAEGKAKDLANHLKKSGVFQYDCEIKTIDYYDDAEFELLKNELLAQDNETFHIIFPGGQCAQEALETNLFNVSLLNTLVVYNSNWSILGLSKIQFGNLDETFHYNLVESSPSPKIEIEAKIEILDAGFLFKQGMFHEAYKNHGVFTPPHMGMHTNSREKQSKYEIIRNHIWEDAKRQLPSRIIHAIKIFQNENVENKISTPSFSPRW